MVIEGHACDLGSVYVASVWMSPACGLGSVCVAVSAFNVTCLLDARPELVTSELGGGMLPTHGPGSGRVTSAPKFSRLLEACLELVTSGPGGLKSSGVEFDFACCHLDV